jgi:IS6 family transposase
MRRRCRRVPVSRSSFAGFRFPPDVITLAVRWYLRYGLSYRDVEELLAERGITVDSVTVFRWVQRFTPLLIDAARPCRHIPGDRRFVEENIRQSCGTMGLPVPGNRPVRSGYRRGGLQEAGYGAATRQFFTRALEHRSSPTEVTTDRAAAYPRVLEELVPAACHITEQYANNAIEADHGRLKSRLRPMRGLKQLRCARVITTGHAFIQTSAVAITNLGPRTKSTYGSWLPSTSWP